MVTLLDQLWPVMDHEMWTNPGLQKKPVQVCIRFLAMSELNHIQNRSRVDFVQLEFYLQKAYGSSK